MKFPQALLLYAPLLLALAFLSPSCSGSAVKDAYQARYGMKKPGIGIYNHIPGF